MLFLHIRLDASARTHRVERAVAELAVLLVAAHAEVDVAVRFVGVAGVDEAGDDLDDLRHLLRGAGVLVGLADVEGSHVREVLGDVLLGERLDGRALLGGAVDELVVDVREVLDAADGEAPELQVAVEHVEDDVAHRVADVR